MLFPQWFVAATAILLLGMGAWLIALLRGRNPLPFPDGGSRIFTTPSPAAKQAVVDLLAQHGVRERFHFDTDGVLRSIMWDGTIINTSDVAVLDKLGHPGASIGLVAADPLSAARDAAQFLQARGFQARIVEDAEPGLPIVFVVTDAFSGTVLNFRKHVTQLPRPTPVP
jgi:hypothetical protein